MTCCDLLCVLMRYLSGVLQETTSFVISEQMKKRLNVELKIWM